MSSGQWDDADIARQAERIQRLRREREAAKAREEQRKRRALHALNAEDEEKLTETQRLQLHMLTHELEPNSVDTPDDYTKYVDLVKRETTPKKVLEAARNELINPDRIIPLDSLCFLDTNLDDMKQTAGRMQQVLHTIKTCSKSLRLRLVNKDEDQKGSAELAETAKRYFKWWFETWYAHSSYTAKGASPADAIYAAWCHAFLAYRDGPIPKVTSDIMKRTWDDLENVRLGFLTNMKKANAEFHRLKPVLAACVVFFMTGKDAHFRFTPRGIDGTLKINRKRFMGTLCFVHWYLEYCARFFAQHEIAQCMLKAHKGVRDFAHTFMEKEPSPELETLIADACWGSHALGCGEIYQHDGSGTVDSASPASDFMERNGKNPSKLFNRFADAAYDELIKDEPMYGKIVVQPEYKAEREFEWMQGDKEIQGAHWYRQSKGIHPAYPFWILATVGSMFRSMDQSVDWLGDYVVWGHELTQKARWLNTRTANGECRLPVIIMIHPKLLFVQEVPLAQRLPDEEDAIEDEDEEKDEQTILKRHFERPMANENPNAKKRLWRCSSAYQAVMCWCFLVKKLHKSISVDGTCFGPMLRQFFRSNKP